MKSILVVCLLFITIYSFGQEEKEISSKINEVTVFIQGAQITRKVSTQIGKGNSTLKFIKLSPFINPKSIQVKANGNILSVKHQANFLKNSEKSKSVEELNLKLEKFNNLIAIEKAHISVLQKQQDLLVDNRKLGGENQNTTVNNLKELTNYYGEKLTKLRLDQIEKTKKLNDLNKSKFEIEQQLKSISGIKEYPMSEIIVKVAKEQEGTINFEITYLVENAGWFPSYDIKAIDIDHPIQLVYKANIKQDTKIDWENVKLKLSSADPNDSGISPELKTYYLNYNTRPPSYKKDITTVTGTVFDQKGEPLPGASIMVKGTSLGATSDFDGKYSIHIPRNAAFLSYSYIGFEPLTLPINDETINAFLEESFQTLDEVVVTSALGIKRNKKSLGYNSESIKNEDLEIGLEPRIQKENQTSFDFEIDKPYTIKSTNQEFSVSLESYNLPANYIYYSVPKVEKNAYLIANIVNWEKYNLLEGEANIFFENTYIGKSLLDVRYATDTLQISLGQDKNVKVQREKIQEFTSKKLVGRNKKENIGWRTIVKNNKNQAITMEILDQLPVSTLQEIEVENIETSDGRVNQQNGEVKWRFDLEPTKSKEFILKYIVKYPKNKSLIIE